MGIDGLSLVHCGGGGSTIILKKIAFGSRRIISIASMLPNIQFNNRFMPRFRALYIIVCRLTKSTLITGHNKMRTDNACTCIYVSIEKNAEEEKDQCKYSTVRETAVNIHNKLVVRRGITRRREDNHKR